MAMRPIGGGVGSRWGTRTGAVRSVYEDFKPVSEWQQDDESHVLNIYLPGFMKEQIKVTTEGRNTIRVRGERLVAGNKWSRFLEDFQVPENGEMNSVRAKFHGGILSVTVPKERKQKGQVEIIPPQTKHSQEDGNQKQPIPHKNVPDKPFPEVGKIQSAEEQVKASAEPKHEPDLDDDRRGKGVTPTTSTGNVISPNAEKEESGETKAKHVASKEPDDATKDMVHKEGKETMGGSELPEAKRKESEKSRAMGIPEKTVDHKDSNKPSKQQNYKKPVKGLTELNEERQLLVNMGVAVLVIVALTAYVTHSFASAKHKN